MKLLAVLMLVFTSVATADPATELTQRLQTLQSLQANFVQLTRDAAGRDVQSIQGQMALSRPNLLYWQTSDPIPQQIVSDGQSLWTYDIDLEQVTRDPVSVLADSPAALLLSLNADDLAERFEVTHGDASPGRTLFQLTPLTDTLYQLIVVEFLGDMPLTLGVIDTLDQQTRISLAQVQMNEPVEASRFVFTPPADVDVLDNRGE